MRVSESLFGGDGGVDARDDEDVGETCRRLLSSSSTICRCCCSSSNLADCGQSRRSNQSQSQGRSFGAPDGHQRFREAERSHWPDRGLDRIEGPSQDPGLDPNFEASTRSQGPHEMGTSRNQSQRSNRIRGQSRYSSLDPCRSPDRRDDLSLNPFLEGRIRRQKREQMAEEAHCQNQDQSFDSTRGLNPGQGQSQSEGPGLNLRPERALAARRRFVRCRARVFQQQQRLRWSKDFEDDRPRKETARRIEENLEPPEAEMEQKQNLESGWQQEREECDSRETCRPDTGGSVPVAVVLRRPRQNGGDVVSRHRQVSPASLARAVPSSSCWSPSSSSGSDRMVPAVSSLSDCHTMSDCFVSGNGSVKDVNHRDDSHPDLVHDLHSRQNRDRHRPRGHSHTGARGHYLSLFLTVITHLCRSVYILGPDRGTTYCWYQSPLLCLMLVLCGSSWPWGFLRTSEACSTRPSPKPRNPRPTWSPAINAIRYNCTGDFLLLYCMNGGTCVMNVLDDSTSYSCDCKMGFFGRRCEYVDTGDRYLAVQQRIETASIAGGVTVLIVITVFVAVVLYVHLRQKSTAKHLTSERCFNSPQTASSSGQRYDRYVVQPFNADFTHPGFGSSRSSGSGVPPPPPATTATTVYSGSV